MNFYVHAGDDEYQCLGTDSCFVWRDLKTRSGAIRRARRIFKGKPFSLYIFTELYDDSTFRCILKGAVFPD
jgi:hypothetical protein